MSADTKRGTAMGLGSTDAYDSVLYDKTVPVDTELSIRPTVEEEEIPQRKLPSYTAPSSVYEDVLQDAEGEELDIIERRKEYSYQNRIRSVFEEQSGKVIGPQSYRDSVEEMLLDKEKQRLEQELKKEKLENAKESSNDPPKKRSRWDITEAVKKEDLKKAKLSENSLNNTAKSNDNSSKATTTTATATSSTPRKASGWGQMTPVIESGISTINSTPLLSSTADGQTASTGDGEKRVSRWGQTPVVSSGQQASPYTTTPLIIQGLATPMINLQTAPPVMVQAIVRDSEVARLNRPLSNYELDQMLPTEADGFVTILPPPDYVPACVRAPYTPSFSVPAGYVFGTGETSELTSTIEVGGGLPDLKPGDKPYFEPLLGNKDENELSLEEQKEIRLLKLLLKVKNGLPIQRKQALRQISDKAREFGPSLLFDKILPILMSKTLEEQERHLLVKVIDRVMYKLEDLVRPYVKDLLLVIQPLLVDEDYYTRVEGREIISNLAKAAGLHTMIKELRPAIDNKEELVRNTAARAFAIVAAALGPQQVMLFLKAVCQSKKSWTARHTGIKIVTQMAILLGCAILPHLNSLVDIISNGLTDENPKVQSMTALAIAALAEASNPYGIEKFDHVLKPLFIGLKTHSGRTLAAFIRAVGFLIPLMDSGQANHYSKELMKILLQQFKEPGQEDMKRIILQVLRQCVMKEGVDIAYIQSEVLNPYFESFWTVRVSSDKRFYREVIQTTVVISVKIGSSEIISKLSMAFKSESEEFRKMAAETVEKILTQTGTDDLSDNQVEKLVDGLVYAFKIQTDTSTEVLGAFSVLFQKLGKRVKPYLLAVKQGVLEPRLTNRTPAVRQITCDLVAKLSTVMKVCEEEKMMSELTERLYENLGEEYPDVLGSILGAMKSIINVIGMNRMTRPSISELLPRLTPILKNRKEKVQENCIDLVGRIADRGKEFVSPKEWMRICFELLEMLKAHKKGIRKAAVATFGYIAAAVGPAEVLSALLNNLRVQERQNRVCTTVAIAIVAETCKPFTVLPALMNEYRVPELNVQNGVLKALSFLFEYISEMGKDYIYAVTPLLEDALMDRDNVHRQTACTVVKHMSLGVHGLGSEDALLHLLNFVWSNIFETSPHVINAVYEAIEGLRVGLGAPVIFQYLLQGLFHPARKVRQTYWKLYNNVYIGAVDSLVPSFPTLPKDDRNSYERQELELFI